MFPPNVSKFVFIVTYLIPNDLQLAEHISACRRYDDLPAANGLQAFLVNGFPVGNQLPFSIRYPDLAIRPVAVKNDQDIPPGITVSVTADLVGDDAGIFYIQEL